jgi:predicted Rossmann fold nucleotide-binding protein DprA/Smf involved in DNA uptake
MLLHLAGGDDEPCRLQLDGVDTEPPPLAEAVRAALRHAQKPCSRAALRQQLRVNNARLGETLCSLEERGLVVRGPRGWTLPPEADNLQLGLSG